MPANTLSQTEATSFFTTFYNLNWGKNGRIPVDEVANRVNSSVEKFGVNEKSSVKKFGVNDKGSEIPLKVRREGSEKLWINLKV